ncbi:MAG: class II aldolase/adducin family protein, partial [Chloroflexota bacterium]
QYSAPEEIAAAVSPETPVLIIENDSILVVGQHIMQAFDRLEVAEFSARSLIDTATIGPMVPIGGDDIAALERAFKLN